MTHRFPDHPQRIALTDELHARPFQPAHAPGTLLHLAFKEPNAAATRDPAADLAHLTDLLDRFGAAHPAPGASHHTVDLGPVGLKWERHTEFVSYTLTRWTASDAPFAAHLSDDLPQDWLDAAPGRVIAAIEMALIEAPGPAEAEALLDTALGDAFSSESLAAAWLLDGNALAVSDFRIRDDGMTRFALIVCGETGPRRIGRAAQRLIEIEVYRLLAMLALPVARETAARLNGVEAELSALMTRVGRGETTAATDAAILSDLTELSAELEALATSTGFRFGARRAYEAIVHQRIEMLREGRVAGRQSFREFMLRRFDPAMRTVAAAEDRLGALSNRAARAAELLRTRVNVALEAQNQNLLESMDRRARLQLRLQHTVEGLSVVAISYYAVNLAGYLLAPLAKALTLEKTTLTALLTVPVVGAVWWFVGRIRRRIED